VSAAEHYQIIVPHGEMLVLEALAEEQRGFIMDQMVLADQEHLDKDFLVERVLG
jgi:hypothetical protein